ncbi:MAG: rRNA (cytosine1402-N4)-methyltransferase [Candidatus Parcubacteria bacterium]|jgi:16S rRNA (cytosine1402-N4)-methyltransferase|nr:rRNA (cytosine1402-N4)-methyltransferase [Candidatus Parcubacteria bacterium]
MQSRHDTVLLSEAVEGLMVQARDVVVDATIGAAGHFALLHEKLGYEGILIGIDADRDAVDRAEKVVEGKKQGKNAPKVRVMHDNFRNLDKILDAVGAAKVDRVLFDLGWSGYHLDSGRGFSFQTYEPLIMTYGTPAEGESAAELVNSATEEELSDILYTYGEERFARKIAKSIVQARKKAPILMTDDLVRAVEDGTPDWYKHRKLHPATKTFQALRIAVNDELGALREGLAAAIDRLGTNGRIAVISFHSIEDRIVKQMFRDASHEGKGTLVTRKPLTASAEETARNPRARSAKLRIFAANVEGAALLCVVLAALPVAFGVISYRL